MLGDEHMEVRCGVVDPSRAGLSKEVISVDSSSSDGSGSSEDSSSNQDSSSSDDGSDGSGSEGGDVGGERRGKGSGSSGSSGSSEGNEEVRGRTSARQKVASPIPAGGVKTSMPGRKKGTSTSRQGEHRTNATLRHTAVPVGIPARGPAVLYRCKMLHGDGATFLVLSCPNVAYISAVRNHAIVRGARGKDR